MSASWHGLIGSALALLLAPLFVGIINRTKAYWGGRRGAPLTQPYFDTFRLLRKEVVLSRVVTPIFQFAPLVGLATALLGFALVPTLDASSALSFPLDFVVLAYGLGAGRVFMMLAALDTGSPFEGMGASREAAFSALAEPTFFVVLATLQSAASDQSTLAGLLGHEPGGALEVVVRVAMAGVLLVTLQAEAGRIPVDDPTTHLELTMIHEVMILDHSGPELGAIQAAAALRLSLLLGLVTSLLVVLPPATPWVAVIGARLSAFVVLSIAIGLVESVSGRFRMGTVTKYLATTLAVAVLVLGANVLSLGVQS